MDLEDGDPRSTGAPSSRPAGGLRIADRVRRWFAGGRSSDVVVDGTRLRTPEERAHDAWLVLCRSSMLRRGGNGLLVMDGPGRTSGICSVWALSQVLAAALDLDRLPVEPREDGRLAPVDDLADTLELYRWGDGYAPYPGSNEQYLDDNAWVGLDAIQAHAQIQPPATDSLWLHKAKRTFEVIAAGQDADGGVRWLAGRDSWHTCSTAPAIELALRLHRATGFDRYLTFAERADAWLTANLVSPEGLYWDNVDGAGTIDRAVHAYNQGTPVGADVLWWRLTGEQSRLDRAERTAALALDHYEADDRLWTESPAFNAVLFRNLLQLHAAVPQARVVAALDRYLERVWKEGRDPATGRFTAGGIGSHDDGGTLVHASIAQLYALQAFPTAWLADVS